LNTRIVSIGACAVLSAVVFAVSPGSAREIIPFKGYSAGTIVIKTNERRLYYVTGAGGGRQGWHGLGGEDHN
jgi:lipoprotein-anchoring transpeptidase ErfK/SrfK